MTLPPEILPDRVIVPDVPALYAPHPGWGAVEPWQAPALLEAEAVCGDHGVRPSRVVGPRGSYVVSSARRAVVRVLADHGWSFREIGALLRRDHTTVLHYARGARGDA